jgi:adenine-specific DNA-methyltransferase
MGIEVYNHREEGFLRPLRALVLEKCQIDESAYGNLYFKTFNKPLKGSCQLQDHDTPYLTCDEEVLTQILFSFDETLSESGRIKTGSYYTPIALVSTLWKMTLIQYLAQVHQEEKSQMMAFLNHELEDLSIYQRIRAILEDLWIGDIAAGTGQMLVGYIHLIHGLDLLYTGAKQPINLQRFILGDIRVESLELLLLMTHLWCHEGIIAELPVLICGDSLAIDGALDQVLKQQKLDILIGNPPYLGEKNSKEIFDAIKATDWGFNYYEGKMDLFYFFIYRGLELIKPTGVLSFITTRYFVTADGATKLRRHVRGHAKWLAFYGISHRAFKSAQGQDNCIFALSKETNGKVDIGILNKTNELVTQIESLSEESLYTNKGNILIAESVGTYTILEAITKGSSGTLGDHFEVNQGIVSGCDRAKKENADVPVFVFSNAEIEKPSSFLKPFYKNSDIDAYFIKKAFQRQMLYLTTKDILVETDWEWCHLLPYKEKLMARREFISGERPWYALHWPRREAIFNGPKLVVPQRGSRGTFAYHEGPFYASADVYYITGQEQEPKALIGLMVYLNSTVVDYYLFHYGKRKGNDLELYATPLSELPLPKDQQWIEKLYPIGMAIYQQGFCSTTDQRRADEAVYEVMQWEKSVVDEIEVFAQTRRKSK